MHLFIEDCVKLLFKSYSILDFTILCQHRLDLFLMSHVIPSIELLEQFLSVSQLLWMHIS